MKICITCFFCLVFSAGFAQNLNYIHYNTNNSKLPHDIVYHTTQTKEGMIYISTDDGLVKFDGSKMSVYETGLVSKYVISVNEENGRLWIATWKGGIHLLEKEKIRSIKNTGRNLSFNTNRIITYDNLVITYCFNEYVVYKYDENSHTLHPFELELEPDGIITSSPSSKEYYKFIKTNDHRLFAYNRTGIYQIKNNKLEYYSGLKVDEISQSVNGEIYYRTGNKIYHSNSLKGSELLYICPNKMPEGKRLVNFNILPSGNVCLGFQHLTTKYITYYLINRKTGETFNLTKEVKTESVIASMTIDRDGNIWMSSDGDGLFHIFDRKYELIIPGKDVENTHITDMFLHTDGVLYIGTKKGIYTYHNKKTIPYYGLSKKIYPYIKKIFLNESGELCASIRDSIYDQVYNISVSPAKALDRQIWKQSTHYSLATQGAPSIIHKKSKNDLIEKIGFMAEIKNFTEDDRGFLWVNTSAGLYSFDPNQKFKKIDLPENCEIKEMLYEKNKGMWLASNQGVFLIDEHNTIQKWTSEEGLSNINVTCLFLSKRKNLWIGTQNGLFCLSNKKIFILKKRDGLLADDVRCFASLSSGQLAVASAKGISLIYPDEIPVIQSAPELLINKLIVDNIEVSVTDEIKLPYKSMITIDYHVISFQYPELTSYEYKINEESDWIQTSNKSIIFSNLEPGNYHLKLRAKNYNSDYSITKHIRFIISPPWWRTWYVIVFATLGLFFLVYFILLARLKKKQNSMRIHQQFAELKLKALQAQLNPHFISNALNTIQYYILKQDEILASEYLSKFADLTRLLLETSRKRFITLETELNIIRLYLGLEQLRFEDKFIFFVHIDESISTEEEYIPGMLIQPFIENSVNHGVVYLDAGVQGIININVKKEKNRLKIIVDDNGIGRKRAGEIKNKAKKAHLSVSTTIVEEISATINSIPFCEISIEIIDKENEGKAMGTKVIICVMIPPEQITYNNY